MQDTIRDNTFLFAIVALGFVILGFGHFPPHSEMPIALGAAFIIAGGAGIYMMLATRQVAKKLHERFNELNDTIKQNHSETTEILKEMASSQKQNHLETTKILREGHSEMMGVLNSINDTLEKKL